MVSGRTGHLCRRDHIGRIVRTDSAALGVRRRRFPHLDPQCHGACRQAGHGRSAARDRVDTRSAEPAHRYPDRRASSGWRCDGAIQPARLALAWRPSRPRGGHSGSSVARHRRVPLPSRRADPVGGVAARCSVARRTCTVACSQLRGRFLRRLYAAWSRRRPLHDARQVLAHTSARRALRDPHRQSRCGPAGRHGWRCR